MNKAAKENRVQCPVCGAWLSLNVVEKKPWLQRGVSSMFDGLTRQPSHVTRRSRMQKVVPNGAMGIVSGGMAEEQWQEITYEEPARTPTIQGDVVVPLGQAVVSGVIVAAIATFGTIRFSCPWWVPIFAGVSVTGIIWWWRMNDLSGLLRRAERYIGKDLDGDGVVGEPPEIVVRIPAEEEKAERIGNGVWRGPVPQRDGVQYGTVFVPKGIVTRDQLEVIAVAVLLQGCNVSRPEFTKGDHKIFSDSKFRVFQQWLLSEGLLSAYTDGRHGYFITGRGRRFLSGFLPYSGEEQ